MNVRYAMVIDQRRCTGCHSCVIACKLENHVPSGLSLNVVLTENSSKIDVPYATIPMSDECTMNDFNRVTGTPRKDYLTRACQHCEDAPCVRSCPTKATWQREDGIVMMDTSLCIGCDNCMNVCPYGYGAMRVKIVNPQFLPEIYGDQDAVKTINNTVKKCTFCAHRLDKGEKPFCVANCPAQARHVGDINDGASSVSMLLRKRAFKQIPVEVGKTETEAFVYFLKP